MSTRHLLDPEGFVVCDANPREDGANTTSNRVLATCFDCLAMPPSRTCQHSRERTVAERESLRDPKSQARDLMTVYPCGKPGLDWRLPDDTTEVYCIEHGPRVLARHQRRLALERSA